MNSLNDLITLLTNAINSNSGAALVLNSALLPEAGQLVGYLNLTELTIYDAEVSPTSTNVEVTGTASFLNNSNMQAVLTGWVTNGEVLFTLQATSFPSGWIFSDSFGQLPLYSDFEQNTFVLKPSFFDQLQITNPAFTLSTFNNAQAKLLAGLNFEGALVSATGTPLDYISSLIGASPLSMYGTIVLQSQPDVAPLINLRADLPALDFTLGEAKVEDVHVTFQTLKPSADDLSGEEMGDEKEYLPDPPTPPDLDELADEAMQSEMGLAGTVAFGETNPIELDISTSMMSSGIWVLDGKSENDSLSLANGLSALVSLFGGSASELQLPPAIQKFTTFYLVEISVGISTTDLSIQQLFISVASPETWVLPFPNFAVTDIRTGWMFLSPFDPSQLSISGYVGGTLEFGVTKKVGLEVTANLPDFTVYAQLRPGDTISVADTLEFLFGDSSDVIDLTINDFTLMVNCGSGVYAVSATIVENWSVPIYVNNISILELERLKLAVNYAQGSLSGKITGYLVVLGVQFSISAEKPRGDQGWIFRGQMELGQTLNLADLVTGFLPSEWNVTLPESLSSLAIIALSGSFNTKLDTFSFATRIEWTVEIAGQPLTLDADFNIRSLRSAPAQAAVYAGEIAGKADFEGLDLLVKYEFKPNSSELTLSLDGFTCAISKTPVGDIVVDLSMGDLSLGQLLTYVVNLVYPTADFQLSSPWDVLNNINFHDLHFEINVTRQEGSVWYDLNLNLDFVDIQSIGVAYQATPESSGVYLRIAGRFLNKTYTKENPLSWDPVTQHAPRVPGKGDELLELRYVGIGQHVTFKDPDAYNSIYQVLRAVGVDFKPIASKSNGDGGGEEQSDSSEESLDQLKYDEGSGWLIAADVVFAGTLTIGGVFNDPVLYGIYIGLSGEKAGIFDGLNFQILYKKISDGLGEYSMQLKLPNSMRHLSFGEFEITLPIVGIAIYTNGNFNLDFGFPYHNDFARSFDVQIFPFIGSGGFYVAYLSGATSTEVPQISNGTFNPVLEFGLGLQLGLGKNIYWGVLKAGLSLDLDGILQGCFAFFTPYNRSQPGGFYYKLQGSLALVGNIHGSVNLSVIKASVSITIYAQIALTIESHEPVVIGISVGISFQLTVKVTFINVHLNFNLNFTESISLGSASPTPWVIASSPTQSPAQISPATVAMTRRAVLATVPEGIELDVAPVWQWGGWQSFTYWSTGAQTLEIMFAPAVTVAPAPTSGQLTPQIVTSLFIENGIPATASDPASPNAPTGTAANFNLLGQGMLAWVLNSYFQTESGAELNQQAVTAADLGVVGNYLAGIVSPAVFQKSFGLSQAQAQELCQELLEQGAISAAGKIVDASKPLNLSPDLAPYSQAVTTMLEQWQQPFSYAQLTTYLQQNFLFSIQPQAQTPAEISGTIFPMFPELAISSAQSGQINFNTPIPNGVAYLQDLQTYFSALMGGQQNFEEKDTTDADKSLATLIFNDYFGLIIQAAAQAANTLLGTYPYVLQATDTLSSISQQLGNVPLAQMVTANQFESAVLNSGGGGLRLLRITYQVAASDTLNSIAQSVSNELHVVSAAEVASANQYLNGLPQAGQSIALASISFTLQPAQDLDAIAAKFYTQANYISMANGGVTDSGSTTGAYDSSNPGVYVPPPSSVLTINNIVYTVAAQQPDTLAAIANYFAVDPALIASLNEAVDFKQTLPVGTRVVIPAVRYIVPPCVADSEQDAISSLAAYFGASSDSITSADGVSFTIANATYAVQSSDTLLGIAHYLGLTMDELVTLMADQPVLALGAKMLLPEIVYPIAQGDTLNGVATNYNVSVADLAEWNAQTTNLLAGGQTWTVPDATVTVETMMNALAAGSTTVGFSDIAAQASRFLLYGLRLPEPGQTLPSSLNAVVTQGLYELTGQQFAIASTPVNSYSIDLLTAAETTLPGWIALPSPNSYALTENDITILNGIEAAAPQLSFNAPQPLGLYQAVNRSFALRNSIVWQCLSPLPYPVQSPPASSTSSGGGPVLWPLPKSLQAQMALSGMLNLNLKTGTQTSTDAKLQTTDVEDYIWGTTIALKLRLIPASPQVSEQPLPNVYQIQGTDEEGRRFLSALINNFKPSVASGLTLMLLYPVNAASGEACGLQSDLSQTEDWQTVQIVKTNLSTSSGDAPPTQPRETVLFNLQQEGFTPSQQTASQPSVFSGLGTHQGRSAWGIELNLNDYLNWASDINYSKSVLPDFPASDTWPTKIRFSAMGAQGGEQIVFGLTVESAGNSFYFNQVFTLTDDWASYELDLQALGVPANFAQNTNVPFWCKVDGSCQNGSLPVQFWIDAGQGIEYTQTISDDPVLAPLADAQSFLELLWEASAVRSGGFYLYYKTAQQPGGLPASLFSGGIETTLTLLALSSDTTSVSPLRNCVVTGETIDAQSVFFAEAPDLQDERLTVEPGHTGFALTQPPFPVPTPPAPTDTVLLDVNQTYSPSGWFGSSSNPFPFTMTTTTYQDKAAWIINYTGTASGQYGGVNWVANDNKTEDVPAGATKITFWAVGANGGEQVKFGFSGNANNQWSYTLTDTWTEYTLPPVPPLPDYTPDDIAFVWVCNEQMNNQKPITFYLASGASDIEYVQESQSSGAGLPQSAVAELYHLLGYRVAANSDFDEGPEGMPVGPGTPPGQSVATTPDSQNLYYSHVLPIPNNATDDASALAPPASRNPYASVGKTLSLEFNAQDMFGNQLHPSGLTSLDLPIRYYDRLTPLTQWPNVAAGYAVNAGPALDVYLDFTVSKYVPDATTPFATCLRKVAGDQLKYSRIYYQMFQPDVSFELITSFGALTTPVDKSALTDFVADIYAYLATLHSLASNNQLTPVFYAVAANDSLESVAGIYRISADDLAIANQSLAGIFSTGAALALPAYYSAQYGDSLASIAQAVAAAELQSDATPQSIAELNQAAPGILMPGVAITVGTSSYTIALGDTFQSIAQAAGVSVDDLATSNQNVANLFVEGARLILLVTTAQAQAGDSLASLAAECSGGVTVSEFAQANLTAALNAGVELSIPCALTLDVASIGNLSLYQVDAQHTSLGAIATGPAQVTELFYANMDLIGVLQLGATVTFGQNASLPTYTIQQNDTLRSVYNYFVALPGLEKMTVDQFALLVGDQSLFADAATLLLPPSPVTLSSAITPGFCKKISAAVVSFEISRGTDLVDGTLPQGAVSAVTTARTIIAPQLATQASPGLSLESFAKNFEAAFSNQIKLGTAQSDRQNAGQNTLLIVPIGSSITYALEADSEVFFAAAPLANKLISRSQVPIQRYESGLGLQASSVQNFANVDLDAWGRETLTALDSFLSAAYAVPAAQIDPESFQAVIEAKQTIAEAIAGSVAPILEAAPAADAQARLQAAQEVLLQQLLHNLSSAYVVDSIIQVKTSADSPYADAASAPSFSGKPVADNFTIDPKNNSLQAMADFFQHNLSPGYVAEVIQTLQGIFDPSVTLSLPDGNTYAPTAADSLRSAAAALSMSVQSLASDIATQKILAPNKALNLTWIDYQIRTGDSLAKVAGYLQVSAADFVSANYDTQGILAVGQTITNPETGQSYVTVAGDTFDTALAAVGLNAINLPQNVIENAGLLVAGQDTGVLKLQPGYAFSTAGLSLANGASYLSIPFRQSGETANRLFLDLNYQINGLQFDTQPLANLTGYERSNSLTFITPLAPVNIGQIAVPVPLRSYPAAPALVAQSATASPRTDKPMNGQLAGQRATQPATLDEIKTWQYQFTYSQHDQAQDEIQATVNFNVTQAEVTAVSAAQQKLQTAAQALPTFARAGGVDLFAALAQFTTAYAQMASDLALLPPLLGGTTPVPKGAQTAISALAVLATQVAEAWVSWHESKRGAKSLPSDFRCRISEYVDDDQRLNVTVTHTAGELPGPYGLPLVVADPAYWAPAQQSALGAPEKSDKTKSIVYTFVPAGDGVESGWRQRSLVFNGLDVIPTQNAWGGVFLTRNEDLIAGQPTNPDFVYRTPQVRFVNQATPMIASNAPIDVAQIGASVGQDSLVDHLSAMFSNLLELGTTSANNQLHQVKLVCRYRRPLAQSSNGQLDSSVPVLMRPTFTFQLRDAEAGDAVSANPSFVQRLAAALEQWQSENDPNGQGAFYQFEVSVFSNPPEAAIEQKMLNFLTRNNTNNLPYAMSRTGMPLSFYADNAYWMTPPNNQSDPNTIDSITERLLVHYGADVYDVATMQIALSLYPDFYEGMNTAQEWTQRLLSGFSGVLQSIRGWSGQYIFTLGLNCLPAFKSESVTDIINDFQQCGVQLSTSTTVEALSGGYGWKVSDPVSSNTYFVMEQYAASGIVALPVYQQPSEPFKYGGQKLMLPHAGNSGPGAYFFRSIADQYLMTDPLTGESIYPNGITIDNIPQMHWTDWKPITGENAWAAIIGPLQLAYRQYGNQLPPYDSDAVQLALKVIPAFQNMRSGCGGIFYAPANTAANEAGQFVDPAQISNENNFSSYAGLTMLLQALMAAAARETDPTKQSAIQKQAQAVQALASGIKSYFQNYLVDATNKCFYTGGDCSGSHFTPSSPQTDPFAVDVHTWGCTVLGAENVDSWFANEGVTAYGLWQTVKQRAGYFEDGDPTKQILGVGYSDVPNNDHQYIISAEWTFGAITMCRVLAEQYGNPASSVYNPEWAASLLADAQSMSSGVYYLLFDTSRADEDVFAYYYANRRYFIPFGWYANRIPSLCSTSWALMAARNFNPFVLGGSYRQTVIDPDSYTVPANQPIGRLIDPLISLREAGIPADQQKLFNFMLVNTTQNLSDPASASNTGMPLSFYATPTYWATLANSGAGYQPNTVAACAERVMVHYGLDIYDAATMQCAFALFPQLTAGMEMAAEQTKRLLNSFSIPQTSLDNPGSIRGWTDLSQPASSQFTYGVAQTPIYPIQRDIASAGAYFFRAISDQYGQMQDPYTGSSNWPGGQQVDGTTAIHWTDWKPITGENAWATMLGPLQLAYSQCGGLPPLDSDAVQLALKVLPAYQAMIAPNGGILYAPWNTAGNQPGTTADPLSISNENNFSSYAALTMLAQALEAGGDTQNLAIVNNLLAGIESYFVNALYDEANQCFYTGGTYNDGQNQILNAFAPGGPNFPFAVDVHTWGCTVLGVEKVDSWFGTNQYPGLTAYSLWQTVKHHAGYYQNGDTNTPILGVGYSDAPNGDHGYIISAEWTFGAINLCRVLAQQYADANSPYYNQTYAADLWNDAQSMLAGVRQILLDTASMSANTEAYFYANRYYVIPFGWDANRIDSLCSTAWALMVANNFNPFVLGGFYGNPPSRHAAGQTTQTARPLITLSNLRLRWEDIQ